jgi:hypothetical protein
MPALIMLTSGFPFKPHIPLDGYTLMPTQNKNHIIVLHINLFEEEKQRLNPTKKSCCSTIKFEVSG